MRVPRELDEYIASRELDDKVPRALKSLEYYDQSLKTIARV